MPRQVAPQQLSDGSLVDDVMGFILGDRVGSTSKYSHTDEAYADDPREAVEQVVWTKFEYSSPGGPHKAPGPDLLLIGYVDGFQIWDISSNDSFVERLSRRDVKVSSISVLHAPVPAKGQSNFEGDRFATARPLLALCDEELVPETPIRLMSLNTEDMLSFELDIDKTEPVMSVHSHVCCVAAVQLSSITLFNPATLDRMLTIEDSLGFTDPYLGWSIVPVALGSKWLAYETSDDIDMRILPRKRSGTSRVMNDSSNIAKIVGLAQKTGTDLWYMGGAGMQKVSEMVSGTDSDSETERPRSAGGESLSDNSICGVVKIVSIPDDTPKVSCANIAMRGMKDSRSQLSKIAHFRATNGSRHLAVMAFDRSGSLLATADTDGQVINVFQLALATTGNNSIIEPRHLYKLNRGMTTALLRQIEFSLDARWVAVVSDRGTTHLFPIVPYGGAARLRTHAVSKIPSIDPFQTSADVSKISRNKLITTSVNGAMAKLKHVPPQAHTRLLSTTNVETSSLDGETQDRRSSLSLEPKRLHGSVTMYFGPYSEDEHSKLLYFPVYVLTMSGALISHKFYPHLNQPKHASNIKEAALESGGILVTDRGAVVHEAFTRSMKTMGHMLEGVRHYVIGSPSLGRQSRHCNVVEVNRGMFNVICVAESWFDLCRQRQWADTLHRKFVAHGAGGNLDALTIRNSRTESESIASTNGSTCDTKDWLAQVELSTYQPPHRRLWMGPQFVFKNYNDLVDPTVLEPGFAKLLEFRDHNPTISPGVSDIQQGIEEALTVDD